jgi:hypothetical protein
VVYPFAGADLAGALAAYPDARSVTTLSAVPFGDVRGLDRLRDPARLRSFLDAVAAASAPLLEGRGGGARSTGRAPAFALFLTALAAHGLEPAGLRYFQVEPGGGLRFLPASALAAPGGGADPFASAELGFVRPGEPVTGARVQRHAAADPSDAALARDPGLLAYLAARGKVAVVWRGGGWPQGTGRLRAAVLGAATVVLGDRTAPGAEEARAAGLSREAARAPVPFGASAAGAAGGLVVLHRR